jgi:hypothetical protein
LPQRKLKGGTAVPAAVSQPADSDPQSRHERAECKDEDERNDQAKFNGSPSQAPQGDECGQDEQRAQAELRAGHHGAHGFSIDWRHPFNRPAACQYTVRSVDRSSRSSRHRSTLIPPNQHATASMIHSNVLKRN